MSRFAFQQWDISVPEPEEGKTQAVPDGAALLALLMDLRDQQGTVITQLQMLNAKADAVVADTQPARKRRIWKW